MTEVDKRIDGLADRALSAIEDAKPEMWSWIEDKRFLLKTATRIDSLRFVAFDLDPANQRIVFQKLGLDIADLGKLCTTSPLA